MSRHHAEPAGPRAGIRAGLRRAFVPTTAELPPVRAWGPWWAGVLVAVAFVAMIWVPEQLAPEGVWRAAILEASILAVLLVVVAWRRRSLGPVASPLRDGRTRIRWIVGGAAAIVAVAAIAGDLIGLVAPDEMKGIGHTIPPGAEAHVAAFLAMCLLAPLVEEIVFRGWLLRSLATRLPAIAAVVVSGTVFGCLHVWLAGYSLGMGFELVFVGMALGLLCLHSGSLLPNIAGHMTLNVTAYLSVVEPKADEALYAVLLVIALLAADRWVHLNRRRRKPAPAPA